MIAPAQDLLRFRLVNLTGREVVIERARRQPLRLAFDGAVVWRNASTPRMDALCGVPLYDFKMVLFAGLPPQDPKFHPITHPAYFLVDPFSAAMLRANKIHRPDVLVMVEYALRENAYHVKSLGVLPPYTE